MGPQNPLPRKRYRLFRDTYLVHLLREHVVQASSDEDTADEREDSGSIRTLSRTSDRASGNTRSGERVVRTTY